MKILLIHRYYWPDTPPYAVMLRDMAVALAKEGHDVTVLSTQPSYKKSFNLAMQPATETVKNVCIIRKNINMNCKRGVVSRLVDAFQFCMAIFTQVFFHKYDLAMIATTPPILGGFSLMVASTLKKKKYIYHCQDIYPEVALCSGLIHDGLLYQMVQWIDSKICKHSAAVVVLSEDMKRTLLSRNRHINSDKIKVINNFELCSSESTSLVDVSLGDLPKGFKVIFAGNIGRFQQLDVVIKAATLLQNRPEIQFIFVGEGSYLDELKKISGDMIGKTVHFIGHQPVGSARKLIAKSDLGMVTIRKGLIGCAFPSKTMTYWGEGLPVLAMVEEDSDLASMISERHLGYVVRPNDVKHMVKVIVSAFDARAELRASRNVIKEKASSYFSAKYVLQRWVSFFKRVEEA